MSIVRQRSPLKRSHTPAPLTLARWALTATAAAALAACGGGGGGEPEPVAPVNQAPTVSLATPAPNATVAAGDTITITATAADSDGTVVRVEFYDGATKLGEDTAAPYEFVWTNASAGAHTISVRAIDNAGATATSASVPVTVNAPPVNQVPTVSITAPATNFKANAPASVKLVANAADADGTVAEVKFYRVTNPGSALNLLGTATKVGGSYELNQTLAAGTYDIVAVVKDNAGASNQSGTVRLIVNALPAVSITSPAAGTSVKVGSNVTLRATASDDDGSINKVEFFLNGSATPLGQATRVGTTNEYTFAWNNVPVGAATIMARATDNDGAVQSSASLAVNVAANVPPTVTLDNPTAGTNAPTTLVLSASAGDSDGTVASVQFFNGAVLLGNGTLAAGKYTLSVPIAAAQPNTTYVVTARATDDLGAQTTTASKSITIAANVPPAVSVTSAAAVTLDAGNAAKTLTLTANATDSDGIAKVEFFNGATKLGEDTTAPFQFSWAGVAAGTYNITARATDTVGSVTTSAAQSLTVTPNVEGLWSTLSTAQKAGLTMTPNRPVEAGGVDAVEILSTIGLNTVIPGWAAALAQSVRVLGNLHPAAPVAPATRSPVTACPGGGTMFYDIDPANPTTGRFYNYDNCVIAGFTFYGGSSMTPYSHTDGSVVPPVVRAIGSAVDYVQLSPTSYRITVDALRVTGNGVPQAGAESFPRNAIPYSRLDCTVTGGVTSCITNSGVNFLWGTDLAWTGFAENAIVPPALNHATDDSYVLNGVERSHHCPPDPTLPNQGRDACLAAPPAARHIRFEAMTNLSGRAIVYGNNGWSVVTRLAPSAPGVERLRVVRTITTATTIGGVTYPVGTAAPEVFSCTVSAVTGDWGCTLVP
jgi:hypothetical protein